MHRLFRTTRDGTRLSLNQMAARVGVTRRMIQLIQTGERGMSLNVGLRVARALGRSPWWVLEYSQVVKRLRKGLRRAFQP